MSRIETESLKIAFFLLAVAAGAGNGLFGQVASLPEAPNAQLIAQNNRTPAMFAAGIRTVPSANTTKVESEKLTLKDPEQTAIKNNPRVSVGRLLALSHSTRSFANQGQLNSQLWLAALPRRTLRKRAVFRLAALRRHDSLNMPARGANASQLVTDFGRTKNLVLSAKLQEQAQNANALATTEDVVLATDQAFYNALQAQALLKLAQQNVDTRQTTDRQVTVLTENKLKSTLDQSFADVNLSQAKLLLLDAQNNAVSTMVALDEVLGLDKQTTFELMPDSAALQSPPTDAEQLLQLALEQRPDLQTLDYNHQAAVKFTRAQQQQLLPTITALGTAGTVPIRPDQYYVTNWWGAAGVNINVPIFNGFLHSAQAKEASIRAEAAFEQTRGLRNHIVRDVRTFLLTAQTTYQRVAVTEELLKQANLALDLAQARYRIGLSSIVELSQAQYQQTDAAIGNTNAQYQYRLALSTLNYEIGTAP